MSRFVSLSIFRLPTRPYIDSHSVSLSHSRLRQWPYSFDCFVYIWINGKYEYWTYVMRYKSRFNDKTFRCICVYIKQFWLKSYQIHLNSWQFWFSSILVRVFVMMKFECHKMTSSICITATSFFSRITCICQTFNSLA